ncbi:hypothetical protein ACP275_08G210100 [Erythranthe tilingii]
MVSESCQMRGSEFESHRHPYFKYFKCKTSNVIALHLRGRIRDLKLLGRDLNFTVAIFFFYYGTFRRISELANGSSSLDFVRSLTSISTLAIRNSNISGSIPSFFGELPSLSFLNLVANNFTIDNSNTSTLPSGLNCLQRNFPCNRGRPIYSEFAVKCGGPQIRSSDQILYEADTEALGPANYYVTDSRRWAVSNVGLPVDNSTNTSYTSSSPSQFTNTLDSELFLTARISAGSLRYYGFGLENGNYTVKLQFAEAQIQGTNRWRSLGRRVFDIYVQGNLAVKDFDARREASGISLRAVTREFTVQVSENYMEIHLFWAGKGTCCIPAEAVYGPSISAISAKSDFIPTVSNNPTSKKKNQTGLIVGIVVAVAFVSFLSLGAVYYVYRRRKKQRDFEDEELLGIEARPYTFSYAELKGATNDFDPSNKLGEGGFGPVYQGMLGDGRAVAVKQLSVASDRGKSQFVAEIVTVSAVQHRNLVKLYGCCIEGDKRLLVYEYLENKSLDRLLFGTVQSSVYLDWPTRYEICLGVARGLAYLHEESRVRIVHRDVKASNILLDSDLTPKISDFGLAKLYDDKKTHISTRVAGTIGYLAPEYAMRGRLTEKADTFGFGVVALEIISGRTNSDSTLAEDKMYLLEWAWNLHENGREIELVDPTLQQYDVNKVRRMIGVALLCTQTSPSLRPAMSRVVAMLSGDVEVATVTSRPGYLSDWKFNDITTDGSIPNSADVSHMNSTTSTSVTGNSVYSPYNHSTPMLHEIIGDGR